MGNKNGKIVLTEEIVEDISKSSGLPRLDVKQQCEAFLEKHPNGMMDKKAFKKFIKMALPDLNMKKMEENTFRMYDTNQDGLISMEEFLIVFHIFSGGTAEDNLQRIFRIFDVDNDGTICQKELKKLVKDMSAIIKENNPEQFAADLIANSAFKEMDKDNDGSITRQEFCSAILYAPGLRYPPLIVLALGHQVLSVPVQNVRVLRINVNVLEEVVKHVPVIALRVVFSDANILVHVEGDDVLEGNLPGLVGLHQLLVHPQWSSASGKTQDKHLTRARVEGIDPLDDILGRPLRHVLSGVPDDELHPCLALADVRLSPSDPH